MVWDRVCVPSVPPIHYKQRLRGGERDHGGPRHPQHSLAVRSARQRSDRARALSPRACLPARSLPRSALPSPPSALPVARPRNHPAASDTSPAMTSNVPSSSTPKGVPTSISAWSSASGGIR